MSAASGAADAALGDQARDQPRRGDVERVVGGRALRRSDPDAARDIRRPSPRTNRTSSGSRSSIGIPLHPVADAPVERGRGQRHVERDAVVARRQGLQIRPDLVGRVPCGRDPVGADDHEVDHPVLHQVPAGVVGHDRVRHTAAPQLPGREPGTLVERPGFVHPHVQVDPGGRRGVDRGPSPCRAPRTRASRRCSASAR